MRFTKMNYRWYTLLLVFSALCTWNSQALPQNTVDRKPENLYSKELQNGIIVFGNNLLKELHNEDDAARKNTLISPINIYTALSLVYLGSAGETHNELSTLLGLQHMTDENHLAVVSDSLSTIIKKLEFKPSDSWGTFTEESIANGVFVQQDFPVKEEYTKFVSQYFSVQLSNLDFQNKSKEATHYINNWISEKTKGRIPELYAEPLRPTTRIVLACALYYSGQWSKNFPVSKTKTEKFNTGAKEIDVQMMTDVEKVAYIANSTLKYEAIKLPYTGGEYEMVFMLPDVSQSVDTLVQNLKAEDLSALFEDPGNEGYSQGVEYKIPRMKFSWKNSLVNSLKKQGIKTLFELADLSRITNANNLYVSDMDHATEIEIDEEGTRASAVTGLKISAESFTSPPPKPKSFYCNRPFLMILYNVPTKTVSFSAVVHQPTV